jgi:hypothetical protein
MMTLRHYFAMQEHPVKSECIAVMSKGYRDDQYLFEVVNSCIQARMGRWKVNGKTKAVSR